MEAESGRVLDRFFERWIYGTRHPPHPVQLARSATGRSTVRFEQAGDHVFDLPVTVTHRRYADGRTKRRRRAR